MKTDEQVGPIQQMQSARALQKNQELPWSPGTGQQVHAMFAAALSGDLAGLRALLQENPALANCHYIYRTPLYFAVRENQPAAAQLLLEAGANLLGHTVDDSLLQVARDRGYAAMEVMLREHSQGKVGLGGEGETLAAAIRAYDLPLVLQLLEEDPQRLHQPDERGNLPVHWATMTRQKELLQELVRRGASLESERPDGARPLQLTNGDYAYRGWRDVPGHVETSAEEMSRYLMSLGAFVDISTAAHLGQKSRVLQLLKEDRALANHLPSYGGYYRGSGPPLKNAAAAGHLEIVELLLQYGADPNLREEGIAPHGQALYGAVAGGHSKIVQLLLEHGAHPNPPVESSADALSIALDKKDAALVELLLSYGAASSVGLLAARGDLQTAAAVFQANPELAKDADALAIAAATGHEPFVRLMLRLHPELARELAFHQYWWVGGATPAINQLLFDCGFCPSQPNWLGETPLHHFARTGDLFRTEQYLDCGADLTLRDHTLCSTPLGWAAKYGHLALAEYLLKRGADPVEKDAPPWATPLSWATRRGHESIAEVLRAAGA